MPSPSISPHSTKASAKKTRTLANWKYIEPRAATPPSPPCQRKGEGRFQRDKVTGGDGDDNRRPCCPRGESPLAPAPPGPADSVARRETRVLEASPKSQQGASRRDTGSLIPRGDPLHLAPVKQQPAATTRAEPAGPQPALPHPVAMTFGIRRESDAPRPARQHDRPARERVRPDVDLRRVGSAQQRRRQHLRGPPLARDPPARQQDQAVAVERGQVEVVQHGEDRHAARAPELRDDVVDARLMAEIEVG